MKTFYWLIQGDCLRVLPTFKDESVDCVITDFPYNVNKFFIKGDYYRLVENVCKEIKRILKKNSNFIFYIGDKDIPTKLNIISKYFNYQWRIIQYMPTVRSFGKTGFSKSILIWWFSKNKGKIYRKIPDIIKDKKEKMFFYHPSFKGRIISRTLVESFSSKGNVVLDPFCGSGSFMEACQDLGRSCIGIEINPKYCQIIKKRCFGRTFLDRDIEYKFTIFNNI